MLPPFQHYHWFPMNLRKLTCTLPLALLLPVALPSALALGGGPDLRRLPTDAGSLSAGRVFTEAQMEEIRSALRYVPVEHPPSAMVAAPREPALLVLPELLFPRLVTSVSADPQLRLCLQDPQVGIAKVDLEPAPPLADPALLLKRQTDGHYDISNQVWLDEELEETAGKGRAKTPAAAQEKNPALARALLSIGILQLIPDAPTPDFTWDISHSYPAAQDENGSAALEAPLPEW